MLLREKPLQLFLAIHFPREHFQKRVRYER